MQQQMGTREEEVSWENFKKRLLEKYFPDSAKHEREAEFLTLLQGNMTVQAYVNRFEYLARFYTQNITEEWRCRKFERGLQHELLRVLVPLRIREFPLLVEQAKSVEQLEMGPSRVARLQRNVVEARHQKKPYNRPQMSSPGLKCFQSRGAHLKRDCPRLARNAGNSGGGRKCFVCDQPSHFADRCPNKKTVAEPRP